VLLQASQFDRRTMKGQTMPMSLHKKSNPSADALAPTQTQAHPNPQVQAQVQATKAQDINVELPCVEGLLAGTLALMTGYAQKISGLDSDGHALLMARKIAANLDALKSYPCLSLPFAAVLSNLERLWADLAQAPQTLRAQNTSMWHGVAASVQ
jgi:hypothetical protein